MDLVQYASDILNLKEEVALLLVGLFIYACCAALGGCYRN